MALLVFLPFTSNFLLLPPLSLPLPLSLSSFLSPHNHTQNVRQEYMDVESAYQERRATYDKVAVGLDLEKQKLEKDANFVQVRACFRIVTVSRLW